MKALCSLVTLSVAFSLTACTLTQKAEDGAADTPAVETAEDVRKDKKDAEPGQGGDNAPADQEGETPASPESGEGSLPTEPTAAESLADAPIVPTEAQQKAAQEMLLTGFVPTDDLVSTAFPDAVNDAPPALPAGKLRMGSILPQEDPASVGDAPAPTANTVELRGLRSPKMPSKLPMGIDGKLQSAQ